MSDLTDNLFYPSAELIWLCIRLNNAWISQIVAFGSQKNRTHTLKSRRTPNESLFGADFGSRGIIGRYFFENEQGGAVTVNGDRYGTMLNEIFIHKTWRGRYWQYLVSTALCYVQYSRSDTRCFAPCFWRLNYLPQSCCRLVMTELRFDTVGLLFVGCLQR